MSAPDTNVKKQEKRHKGPLLGIGAVVAFALLLLVIWIGWVFYYADDPSGNEATGNVPANSQEAQSADGTGGGSSTEDTNQQSADQEPATQQ